MHIEHGISDAEHDTDKDGTNSETAEKNNEGGDNGENVEMTEGNY